MFLGITLNMPIVSRFSLCQFCEDFLTFLFGDVVVCIGEVCRNPSGFLYEVRTEGYGNGSGQDDVRSGWLTAIKFWRLGQEC